MTPTDMVTAARDLYNAVGDTYFSDLQIYNWLTQAANELNTKAMLVEQYTTGATVAAQQIYSYPTNAFSIKRITINGKKIKKITNRDDDAITLSNQTATTMGWPIYYTDWAYQVWLRPIPDGVYTIGWWTFALEPTITAVSTLITPANFHMDLVDYALARMFMKDKNVENVQMHMSNWKEHVRDAVIYQRRLKRTDSFATVQSEDSLPVTILGEA